MDDYKKYIYMRNPERYENIKTGDLSFQLAIKEKLQCKPFSYFIERVAPDMLQFYPLIDPPPFARGAVSFSLFQKQFEELHHLRFKACSTHRTASTRLV